MDAQAITTMIGSLGFPIVMCIIMIKLIFTMEQCHKEEINSLKESFNNNTNVLTKLETMLNIYMKDKEEKSNAKGN